MATVVASEEELVAPTDFATVQTPREHERLASTTSDRAHSILRKWYAIRWHLARTVFAKPVPLVTSTLQLKLGDILVTLPIAAAFIVINIVACLNGNVSSGGTPAAIVLIIVFALTIRNNSILLTVSGLPFERALFYHKLFAGVAWLVAGLHGLTYLLHQDENRHEGAFPRQLSGALTFYALSALVAFAFEPIRRRFFNLFLRFHWIFFILLVVFGVLHGAAIILIGFVPWGLDMIYRMAWNVPQFGRQASGIHAQKVTIKLVTKDLVRIQFLRFHTTDTGQRFHHEAGQYAFLCIPQVARVEWHPFTIASAPHESHVTFYVKVLGDWTKQLAALAASHSDGTISVLVDGPYGAVGIEMDHYSHLVFVSGGIGVTPMNALVNKLHYQSSVTRTRRVPLKKAWFVWAVRDRELLQALVLDDPHAIHPDAPPPSWFPHHLTTCTERDAIVADLYLTNKSQDLSDPVDQQLQLCLTHNQRPDLEKILRTVGESALLTKPETTKGPVRVGVLVCGPAAMVGQVSKQSQDLFNTLGVIFDVHEETFAW